MFCSFWPFINICEWSKNRKSSINTILSAHLQKLMKLKLQSICRHILEGFWVWKKKPESRADRQIETNSSLLWAFLNDLYVPVCVGWSQMLNQSDLTGNKENIITSFVRKSLRVQTLSVCSYFLFRVCHVIWRRNRFIIVRFDFAVQIKICQFNKTVCRFSYIWLNPSLFKCSCPGLTHIKTVWWSECRLKRCRNRDKQI